MISCLSNKIIMSQLIKVVGFELPIESYLMITDVFRSKNAILLILNKQSSNLELFFSIFNFLWLMAALSFVF